MTPHPLRRIGDERREVDCTAAPVSPPVEVGAPEEELATTTVLVDGDRALGGKLPERVAVDAEVLSCATRVQPLGSVIARYATKMLSHRGSHASHELVEESVENQELWIRGVGERHPATLFGRSGRDPQRSP